MPSCKQICPHEEEEEEEQKFKKKTISEHFANFHDAPGGPARGAQTRAKSQLSVLFRFETRFSLSNLVFFAPKQALMKVTRHTDVGNLF